MDQRKCLYCRLSVLRLLGFYCWQFLILVTHTQSEKHHSCPVVKIQRQHICDQWTLLNWLYVCLGVCVLLVNITTQYTLLPFFMSVVCLCSTPYQSNGHSPLVQWELWELLSPTEILFTLHVKGRLVWTLLPFSQSVFLSVCAAAGGRGWCCPSCWCDGRQHSDRIMSLNEEENLSWCEFIYRLNNYIVWSSGLSHLCDPVYFPKK